MDRNFGVAIVVTSCVKSLSARRAWIEISYEENSTVGRFVALRKESVDRNFGVAIVVTSCVNVALRKESVDRNINIVTDTPAFELSLSARRAWIEITRYISSHKSRNVALRKESVDRNFNFLLRGHLGSVSLSARRAWIEIHRCPSRYRRRRVALRKESVDRNTMVAVPLKLIPRRSPQGERG